MNPEKDILLYRSKGYLIIWRDTMIENAEARAKGFRSALGKSLKIKELKITSSMTEDEIDMLVELRSKAKAESEGGDWKKYVAGQRWYIEDLVKFAQMPAIDRLSGEVERAFPDVATETEMLEALEALI